jgi:hypothetical protein
MPQLPQDIIDRLTAMERRIQQLSTAVKTRPATTGIGGSAIRVYDIGNNEIIADDDVTGGLARPWLNLLPPQNTNTANWPQTTARAWTPIARSYNVIWQPQMRLLMLTAASSGAAGQVKVLVDGQPFGSVVTANNSFDFTGPVCDPTAFAGKFGTYVSFEVQAIVTSTSGSVYAMPQMMYGTQS